MRIIQRPSPNFNARRAPLDMLVLHYTGMEDAESAEARLCAPEAEVSAHYVVREDGLIVAMVDESQRAWHAGVANWQGDSDINSRSIGIEIVNGGHDFPNQNGTLPRFPDLQISAVISLSQAILARHAISQTRIVGHSDIAPGRKQDPGEHFPWPRLCQAGLGIWPACRAASAGTSLIGRGLGVGDSGDAVSRLQTQLAQIGYGIEINATFDRATGDVVTAFQRRWLPEALGAEADLPTLIRIDQIADLYASPP